MFSYHIIFYGNIKQLGYNNISMLQVPRVFVKGKPIGGCEEIEQLNKDGKLSDILRD